MHHLAYRWTIWSSVLLLSALLTVGSLCFLMPPEASIPLISVARSPSLREVAGLRDPVPVAELADLVDPTRPAVYREMIAGRRDVTRAVAGHVAAFPVPSLTYLSNVDVYLVRTTAGFSALWSRDPDRRYRTRWDASRQRFVEPNEGVIFSLTGRCLSGPCFGDLGRYTVEVDGDTVLVDLRVRVIQR